jgi:hypothetical protein
MSEDVTNVNPIDQGFENRLVNKSLSRLPIPNITGLKLEADIQLGPLLLNTIDDNNVIWVCTDLDGWWNLPDPELPDLPRGWGDGSYDSRGRYASRLITLEGAFLTQDPGQVEAARQKLFEAIDLVYDSTSLTVAEKPYTKTSLVRLSGRPQVATVSARGRTEFSIALKASDPIKYEFLEPIEATPTNAEAATPSSGSVTYTTSVAHGFIAGEHVTISGSSVAGYNGTFLITSTPLPTTFVVANSTTGTETWSNASAVMFEDGYRVKKIATTVGTEFNNFGNTKTPVIIELTGPIPGGGVATITNKISYLDGSEVEETITIVEEVPSGSTLEIDTLNREAVLVTGSNVVNGRSYISTLSSWFYIYPDIKAENEITFTSATGLCKVFYRSGWIG